MGSVVGAREERNTYFIEMCMLSASGALTRAPKQQQQLYADDDGFPNRTVGAVG